MCGFEMSEKEKTLSASENERSWVDIVKNDPQAVVSI